MVEITADSTIYDLLKAKPESSEVLFKFGMGCVGCAIARVKLSGRQPKRMASLYLSSFQLSELKSNFLFLFYIPQANQFCT